LKARRPISFHGVKILPSADRTSMWDNYVNKISRFSNEKN